ncbi:hypothetical protein, partial [Pseudomonas zeae]|uniref:hypothetical protein n=1 Tax=Pseudomonas zeae TaxID=2745510 RepID=UPI003D0634E8
MAATNQFFASRLSFGLRGFFLFGALAAFGPTMLWVFFVNIRFCGCRRWRFRSYSDSLFQTPKSKQKAGPRRS